MSLPRQYSTSSADQSDNVRGGERVIKESTAQKALERKSIKKINKYRKMLIIFFIKRCLGTSSKCDIRHRKDKTVLEMDEKHPAVNRKVAKYLLPVLL